MCHVDLLPLSVLTFTLLSRFQVDYLGPEEEIGSDLVRPFTGY